MASERLKLIKAKIQVKLKAAQRKAAKELAQAIPEVIKIRTRLEGQGADGRPLADLEDSTIATRSRYSQNLHPDTTPGTSNLTATGQMLDAVTGKSSGTKVTIEVRNNRRRRELSGARSDKTNKEVQRHVEKAGREFLELSRAERVEAEELAAQIIKEELSDITN